MELGCLPIFHHAYCFSLAFPSPCRRYIRICPRLGKKTTLLEKLRILVEHHVGKLYLAPRAICVHRGRAATFVFPLQKLFSEKNGPVGLRRTHSRFYSLISLGALIHILNERGNRSDACLLISIGLSDHVKLNLIERFE